MQRLQVFKYELMPDGEQQRNMRRFAGSCRFVFNKALALQQAHYAESKKKLSYADLCKQLTEWRKSSETQWLSETHSQPLQQTLKDLERAYLPAAFGDPPCLARYCTPAAGWQTCAVCRCMEAG